MGNTPLHCRTLDYCWQLLYSATPVGYEELYDTIASKNFGTQENGQVRAVISEVAVALLFRQPYCDELATRVERVGDS